MRVTLNEQMLDVVDFFKDMGKVYFVGGCVRDLIMGVEPHDYDLTTAVIPSDIETYIKWKGRRPYLTGKRFGTIAVKINGILIEVTTFRKEIYDFKTRNPCVEYSHHLQEDLQRRDFTINSLVCDSKGTIKDYFDGGNHIQAKHLCAVGNPKLRFKEDPLRILRGIRFIGKYNLTLDKKTAEKMNHCRWELLRISKERIIDEINKMFKLSPDKMLHCMVYMFDIGIFQIIMPSLHLQLDFDQKNRYHYYRLHEHTLSVMWEVSKGIKDIESKQLWAALLHDVAKPYTQTEHKSGTYCNYISHDILGAEIAEQWLRAYKFSNVDREFIVDSITNHLSEDCWLRKYDNLGKHNEEVQN